MSVSITGSTDFHKYNDNQNRFAYAGLKSEINQDQH